MSNINQSRRRFFSRKKSNAIRPPWSKTDIEFTDICTRCNDCIKACETQVIIRGDGGFPEINFTDDGCTFCKKCAVVCPEPLFTDTEQAPWVLKAVVQESCLANRGVWCQSCKDGCDERAISFKSAIGQAPKPIINTDLCTGCGACAAPCPTQAIKLLFQNQ